MRINTYTQANDKDKFIKEFSSLNEVLLSNKNRPMPSPLEVEHLLNVFDNVKKELVLIKDEEGPVGRVCVNTTAANKDYIFFGLLEYDISRKEVLKLLMKEVENFAKKNNKINILGPIDLNVWMGNRFKSKGHDDNRSWEPHTPKNYLNDTLELGYQLDQDYLSCFYTSIGPCFERTKPAFNKVLEENFALRNVDITLDGEVDKLFRINTTGFNQNYFYEPITQEQYELTHIRALEGFNFQYSFFLLNPKGEEIGYVFSYPDKDNRLIVKSIVMNPNFRGAKLSSALVHATVAKAKENGLTKVCGACVRKGNVSEHFFDHLGEKEKIHEYTLVKKSL